MHPKRLSTQPRDRPVRKKSELDACKSGRLARGDLTAALAVYHPNFDRAASLIASSRGW